MSTISVILCLFVHSFAMRPCLATFIHVKCRGGLYPRSSVQRFEVPDEKVNWSTIFEDYSPITYNAATLQGKPWADVDIGDPTFKPKWNSLDNNVNRVSYMGNYTIQKGYPLNPMGRTGMRGRGVLGRWGPNHAADPVVSRWKLSDTKAKALNSNSQKPILQFIAIKRRDTGEWALPGGMVDPGEKVTSTAIREFQEEATNSLLMSEGEKSDWKVKFDHFFQKGDEVYKGYVDDPRNTDNAWMETAAYSFHDGSGETVGSLELHAGDDAVGVRWVDADGGLQLYASHRDIVQAVVNKLNAHW